MLRLNINPFLMVDGYKPWHINMYPDNTVTNYSNFTPRSGKYSPTPHINGVINYGGAITWKFIQQTYKDNFFKKNKDKVCQEVKTYYSNYYGEDYDVSHIEDLHDLGHLPIEVKLLPEGILVPYGVPVMTLKNTNHDFAWLTNFLESAISNLLWRPMTSATTAFAFKKLGTEYCKLTGGNEAALPYQFHDFSYRGFDSPVAAAFSGLGFMTSFIGTDTMPALAGYSEFYGDDKPNPFAAGVPATEHSIQCAYYDGSDLNYLKEMIKKYPTGILSVVLDGYDLWKALEDLRTLKDEVMARDGKLVIRPDSGDPVDIVCGINYVDADLSSKKLRTCQLLITLDSVSTYGAQGPDSLTTRRSYNGDLFELTADHLDWVDTDEGRWYLGNEDDLPVTLREVERMPSDKGVLEILWDIFGGTTNEQGYRSLDSHIGVIYGDGINFERATKMFDRMEKLGFVSTDIVLGVGSYTLGGTTRDSHGTACKSTYQERIIDGKIVGKDIFKNPITDDGTKKSAKGRLSVERINGKIVLKDQRTKWVNNTMLQPIWGDNFQFDVIKANVENQCNVED